MPSPDAYHPIAVFCVPPRSREHILLGVRYLSPEFVQIRYVSETHRKGHFIGEIVGRNDDQDAQNLLEIIKSKLENSSFALFDATGGNANVSLEYGYAEAKNIPRALYLSSHKAAHKSRDLSIVSDLAGKRRNHYSNEQRLQALLQDFSKKHPYALRFETTLVLGSRRLDKGKKKRLRSLALKQFTRSMGNRMCVVTT